MSIHRSHVMSEDEYMLKLSERGLTRDGAEIADGTPMEPPVGYVRQPSMFDNVREMVKREMALRMQYEDETQDDEEDFDVPDYDEPVSPHTYTEDDERMVRAEVVRLNKEIADKQARLKAQEEELASYRKSAATPKVPQAEPAAPPQPVRSGSDV